MNLLREWEKELLKIPKKKKPSLLKAIIRIWYMRLLANFILVLLEVITFAYLSIIK